MKITSKKTVEVDAVNNVICNKCGYSCRDNYVSLDVDWGYSSNKDLQRHKSDVCEACYDAIVSEFKIPPYITYYAD